ncbi:MAG: KamA family radical SAM protein [Phycisphaerae bacterium]|nr:KamA family radical SAM protein [Phycisphaerae bacterium]
MPWRDELKRSISTFEQLERQMPITAGRARWLRKLMERHPMRLTRYYASLINWSDPDDPVMRMAVPCYDELNPEGSYDTGGERSVTKMPGLQHKYGPTALILATNRCAMYCRHCFRKRLVGLKTEEILARFDDAVDYIRQHEEINNVLISGGDPLVLSTRVVREFLRRLYAVDHLRFVRIGSRVPVTFPQRILEGGGLLDLFAEYARKRKRLYVTTHFNHPREITDQSTEAVSRLIGAGVIVNNQTVLLRGVNDSAETMTELLNSLVGIRAIPYYVFQCRPVKRVRHGFQVSLARGYRLIEEAKDKLSGYAKRFRYMMSHRTGKIEIVGILDGEIYFKYHEAKNPKNAGRLFKRKLDDQARWLDDLE